LTIKSPAGRGVRKGENGSVNGTISAGYRTFGYTNKWHHTATLTTRRLEIPTGSDNQRDGVDVALISVRRGPAQINLYRLLRCKRGFLNGSMLSKKVFLTGVLNFSTPPACLTRDDVGGHIVSQEIDHRASYVSC
jgi:hypothetical protein